MSQILNDIHSNIKMECLWNTPDTPRYNRQGEIILDFSKYSGRIFKVLVEESFKAQYPKYYYANQTLKMALLDTKLWIFHNLALSKKYKTIDDAWRFVNLPAEGIPVSDFPPDDRTITVINNQTFADIISGDDKQIVKGREEILFNLVGRYILLLYWERDCEKK